MDKTKILLVEDSPLLQKVGKAMFEQLNCKVDIASTGEDSILLSQQNHYDLILMDIGLPGIDGVMATQLIREQEKTRRHPPIVALTTQNDPELRAQAIAAGMDDYWIKPLNAFNAQEILSRYCNLITT